MKSSRCEEKFIQVFIPWNHLKEPICVVEKFLKVEST